MTLATVRTMAMTNTHKKRQRHFKVLQRPTTTTMDPTTTDTTTTETTTSDPMTMNDNVLIDISTNYLLI